MSTRVAPIFPVSDLAAALATTAGLVSVPANGRAAGTASSPFSLETKWGQHEGVLNDPDGNVIRFGSPMGAD
jgi:hypothetical protein